MFAGNAECRGIVFLFQMPHSVAHSLIVKKKKGTRKRPAGPAPSIPGVLLRAFFRLLTLRRKRRDGKVLDLQQWRKMGGASSGHLRRNAQSRLYRIGAWTEKGGKQFDALAIKISGQKEIL
jgi:hypothetical protein